MTAPWTIHTDVFDGPLDLLLYLVRRDGIDLRALSIAKIASAYLDYLDRMREVHLGIASEYLVMAATLCHLKSLELLPRLPTSTDENAEEVDPRANLVRQLLEHECCRQGAEGLVKQPIVGRDVFVRLPEEVEEAAPRPMKAGCDAFALLDLYHALLRRQAEAERTYDLGDSGPDIGACCRCVLEALGGPGGQSSLEELLARVPRAVDRIVTFLAVLEMTRLRWIELVQSEHLGPVWLTSQMPATTDVEAVVGRIQPLTDVEQRVAG